MTVYKLDNVDKALNKVLKSFDFLIEVKRDNRARRLTFTVADCSNYKSVVDVADKTYNKFGKEFKLAYKVWAVNGLSAFRIRRELAGLFETVKFRVCEQPGHLEIARGRGKHPATVATIITE